LGLLSGISLLILVVIARKQYDFTDDEVPPSLLTPIKIFGRTLDVLMPLNVFLESTGKI